MSADPIRVTEHCTEYGLPYVELRGCVEFDPVHIFECGQCFRWNRLPGDSVLYTGVAAGRVLAVSAAQGPAGKVITLANTDLRGYEAFWKNYFDFERDYTPIRHALSAKDDYLKEAAAFGSGIRILRQEPFETLLSFILSSNNNIPRIKGCIEKLAAAYGEKVEVSGAFSRYLFENSDLKELPVFYTFPSAQRLQGIPAQTFSLCCKAGYRCAYLENTARAYAESPFDAAAARSAALPEARKMIRSYAGVGPKVADCVLLFAGLRTDVFPVDVWVRRVLENLYFQREVSPRAAEAFAASYFGSLAGFAQQYLFYAIRGLGLDFFTEKYGRYSKAI